jgi:hypothetical protein
MIIRGVVENCGIYSGVEKMFKSRDSNKSITFTYLISATFCIAAIWCNNCFAAESIDLKLRLEPKQKYSLRIIEKYQSLSWNNAIINNEVTNELEFEVEKVDADNVASIKVTYLKLKEKSASQYGQREYDSTNPEISADNPFALTYSSMIGQGFIMKVSPQGKILELTGVDEMYLKMAEKLADSEDEDLRKKLGDKAQRAIDEKNKRYGSRDKRVEALKERLKKNPMIGEWRFMELVTNVVVPFTGKPIGIGDSWQAGVMHLSMLPDEIEETYTLKEKNRTFYTIDISSKIDMDNVAVTEGRSQAKVSLKGSYEGSLQIDQTSGWLIRKNATLKITGEMKIAANKQMPKENTTPISKEYIITVEPIE